MHLSRIATVLVLAAANSAMLFAQANSPQADSPQADSPQPNSSPSRSPQLQTPTAIAIHPGTGHAFISEQGKDRLVRWDGTKVDELHAGLSEAPVLLSRVVGATFRNGNRITLVGSSKKDDGSESLRLATFKVDVEELANFDTGMSTDLELDGADSVTAIASTDFAIYLATRGKQNKLWRVPAGKASFGKPQALRRMEDNHVISALTVTSQGHVVATVQNDREPTQLRFFHAETGQQLLDLPTDVKNATALSYDRRSGRLYALANKTNSVGVFRMDAVRNAGRQTVQAVEVSVVEGLTDFRISEKGGVGIVNDEEDEESGRVVLIELQ